MTDEICVVAQSIADELLTLMHSNIEQTGKTSKNNNLLKDRIKVEVIEDGGSIVVRLLYDNYLNYIDQGRRPQSGKQPPIEALRDWALGRNIPTDNSTLYLISRAIWRDGIEPRPILSMLDDEVAQRMDSDWRERVADAVMQVLSKAIDEGVA